MQTVSIWHNPRCSKSRLALQELEKRDVEINVRKYLDDAPSKEELINVLTLLGCKPKEMMRTKEALFKELGLKEASDEVLIEAMLKHPKLIERPIVIKGEKAVIGRPTENVVTLLEA